LSGVLEIATLGLPAIVKRNVANVPPLSTSKNDFIPADGAMASFFRGKTPISSRWAVVAVISARARRESGLATSATINTSAVH
jgi:hypothetical protein